MILRQAFLALLLLGEFHRVDSTNVFLAPVPAKNGTALTTAFPSYKYLIVENDVGSYEGTLGDPPLGCGPTDPGYPHDCDWPSIRTIKARAQVCNSGDSTEWNAANPLAITRPGKYMATVMAEGFKLCGGYFDVKMGADDDILVTPVCQEFPLPLGTIRLFVFEDSAPCNGQYDPGEKPLPDFGIGVNDLEGPIVTGKLWHWNACGHSARVGRSHVPHRHDCLHFDRSLR